ncbi:aa3-type cytochrome c oxidase subunit IV [Parasphingorhabdus sp.]
MTSDNNLSAAQETYAGFLSMLKVGTILTAIVAILVVILIS